MPAYNDVTLGKRSTKAIGNVLRDLKKKYGSTESNITGAPKSKSSVNATKATTKTAAAGVKRTATTAASSASKKQKKTVQPSDTEQEDNEEEV